MNNTRLSLSIRHRLSIISSLFSRYLTVISMAVLLIGLLLIALGPLRALLAASSGRASRPATGASSPSVLPQAAQDLSPVGLIERQFVPFTTIPNRPRKTVTPYTIQPGDTLFAIAAEFGIKPETIFWSNKSVLNDDIHLIIPGTTLAILPFDGVYMTADGLQSLDAIAAANNGEVTTIVSSPVNELAGYTGPDAPPWGMKIAIPGGSREIVAWTSGASSQQQTDSAGRTTVVYGYRLGMPGSCAAGTQGAGGTGAWISPINPGNYTVTQGYASWHSGIDLAANVGTPVHAADTGVVIFAGWDETGYGNLVILDHGNGWITYYGHLNSISVRCGQLIQRGSTIGASGTTGNSSGPHLHFEMRWQDRPANPAIYVGF